MTEHKLTATALSMRPNVRSRRADNLAHEVMAIVSRALDRHPRQDAEREIFHELSETFRQQGVEIITDADRAAAGLPARDGHGWTPAELLALENHRITAMTRPIYFGVDFAARYGADKIVRSDQIGKSDAEKG
jgi:hypothetical protein